MAPPGSKISKSVNKRIISSDANLSPCSCQQTSVSELNLLQPLRHSLALGTPFGALAGASHRRQSSDAKRLFGREADQKRLES